MPTVQRAPTSCHRFTSPVTCRSRWASYRRSRYPRRSVYWTRGRAAIAMTRPPSMIAIFNLHRRCPGRVDMLSKEDNELLTRVGPGTPMGELLRQYWIPVVLCDELPANDGPPMRARLLNEDLILFRDTGGRVGLLGDHCPHRGASLFFGRNEEEGLR